MSLPVVFFKSISQKLIANLKLLCRNEIMEESNERSISEAMSKLPPKFIITSSVQTLKRFEEELISSKLTQDPALISVKYFTLVCNVIQDSWRSALRITVYGDLCKDSLSKFKTVSSLETLRNFLQNLYSLMHELQRSKQAITFSKSSAIVLCLYQIKSNLPSLIDSFKQESGFIMAYASKCLSECVDNVVKEVCECTELPCSEFIDLMDCVLCYLERPKPSLIQLNDVQEQVDELLCHAMATAQVAVTAQDAETIKAKCQVVLRGLESLKDAVTEDDTKEVSFMATVVSDALCDMERSVNNAVLRLVLDVCSGVQDPFKKLVDHCKPDSASVSFEKHPSDLDDSITSFDAFMDRLMQVGTFAVSCSSNVRKAIQLRSCLASFESLEAEVVPCVTALYLDPVKRNKIALSLLLKRWQSEIAFYQKLLSSIVDPPAYVQVVGYYLKEQKQLLEDSEEYEPLVNNMVKAVRSIQPVILTTLEQDALQDSTTLKNLTHNLKIVSSSCLKLLELHPKEDAVIYKEKIRNKVSDLVLEMEYLWEALARQLLESETPLETLDFKIEASCAKDYYKLCVSDNMALMTPIAARGVQMAKEEAVFYNTPKRSTVKRPALKTPICHSAVVKNIPPSTVRSRCFRTPAPKTNQTMQEEESMELTHLLDELTKLDDTFGNSTVVHTQKEPLCGKQLLQLFENWEMPDASLPANYDTPSTAVENSLDSRDVGSFERLKDLEIVQNKIDQLKASDDEFVTVINIP